VAARHFAAQSILPPMLTHATSSSESLGIPRTGQNANHLPPKTTPPGYTPTPNIPPTSVVGCCVVGLSNSVVSAAMGRMIY